MIARALNALGLVTRVEHEAVEKERDDALVDLEDAEALRDRFEAKFKLAATDLAKQAEEVKRLTRGWDNCGDELNQVKRERDALQRAVNKLNAATDEHLEVIAEQDSTIDALRPDALLWRNARDKRSRDRKGSKAT